MWNGKNKAITFSFDDAVSEDKKIIEKSGSFACIEENNE